MKQGGKREIERSGRREGRSKIKNNAKENVYIREKERSLRETLERERDEEE